MSKRRMEQKEIDLEFFLYQLLEQWRVLLLVGLVFAIIFPIGAYVKNSRSTDRSDQLSQTEETATETAAEPSNAVRDTVILYFAYYNCRGEYVKEMMAVSPGEQELNGEALATAYQNYTESVATLSDEDRIRTQEIIQNGTEKDLSYYNDGDINRIIKEYFKNTEDAEPEKTLKTAGEEYAVIGFVVGICLCVLYKFFFTVLYGCFICEREIDSVMQTRNFGSVYKYPYKSLWGRFAHSKAVYNRYHRCDEFDKIANNLAQKILHENCKKVTLITLGTVDERYHEILKSQSEILAAKGIAVDIVALERYASEKLDSEYVEMEAVFAQVISHKTTFETALDFLGKLDEYNINLIGTEFVEI